MAEAAVAVAHSGEESREIAKQNAMTAAREAQAEMLAKLKRDDAKILDELLDSDLVEEEERVSMDSIQLDDYRVADKSCGCFTKASWLRVNAFWISQTEAFRNFILMVILYNIVVMANATDERVASPEPVMFGASFKEVYDVNDLVITTIFTLEVVLGMIAHGVVIGRHSFCNFNAWNKLDILVVVTAWFNILEIGAGSFGFLRALRVLRVLKALKHEKFKGIRKIINSLGQSVGLLQNVGLLSFFAYYLFAVFGLNMFMGRLRGSCEGGASTSNMTDGLSCEDFFKIGSNARIIDTPESCPEGCVFTMGAGHELCDVRGQCYANFDNIVWAVLTVFRSVSMEGWTDICYVFMTVVEPGFEWVVVLYFSCLLMLVTNLVVNLFVAVICTQFAGTKISKQGHEDLVRLRRLRGLWLQQDPGGEGTLRTADLRRILRKVLNTDQKVDDAIALMTLGRQREEDLGFVSAKSIAQRLKEGDKATTAWRFDELLAWARGDLVPEAVAEEEQEKKETRFARFINWLERLTGIDIDGDGDIGVIGPPPPGEHKAGEDAANAKQMTIDLREAKMFEERAELLMDGSYVAKLQQYCMEIVKTSHFGNFILGCVICNTVFLALEHHGQSDNWKSMLLAIERVFLVIFTIEMIVKWLGLGVKNYFGFNANKFDFVLVTVSLIEQGVILTGGDGALGPLSVLRSFRLLRVFRAMRRMAGLRSIIQLISESSEGVWSAFLLVMFVLVIFSLLGMQLFTLDAGEGFVARCGQNFDTFWSSMLLLFQVLTGENWVELLEMGMARDTFAPVALFVCYYIIVVYVLLNIFVALIMDNFVIEDDKKRSRQAAQFLHEFMTLRAQELADEKGGKKIKKKMKKKVSAATTAHTPTLRAST
jgi:hypothetical protein